MTSRDTRRIRFNGKEFLNAGLNVTDNPLIVTPQEMVEAPNILVGSTPARKKRGGQAYFNTNDSDATANYPLNPKNNGGSDGDPILGIYEFWRYDFTSGSPKSTLLVRQGSKIWGIDSRTDVAIDLTGSLVLPTTGSVTFQAFEGRVYWTSTNDLEGLYCWDGQSATAIQVENVKASINEAIPGVTGNLHIEADVGGTLGNSVSMVSDGIDDVNTIVANWNAANPNNTVTLISANGTDVPAVGNIELSGGLQKLPPDGVPSYIVSHNGRMWGFGVPGYPYRLYASEFYDAESWATNPFGSTGTAEEPTSLDLDPFGDPLGINGGVSFQGRFYAFMGKAIFEVSGFTINDFAVRTISRQVGCVGHKTIQVIGNDVIYASERGILRLSSTDKAIETDYAFLSRPLSKLWNEKLNRSLSHQYSASYDESDNLYLLSCSSAGNNINDTILVYNVQSDLWTIWDNHKARVLSTYIVDGVSRVISGREDGILALLGDKVRKDLGASFTARFRTGILFPGGEMDIEHIFKSITILASTDGIGTLTLNAYVDSKLAMSETLDVTSGKDILGTSFILGQSILGNGVFLPITHRIGDKGYGLQLEVLFNTEDDVEVYGFMADVKSADHRIAGGA